MSNTLTSLTPDLFEAMDVVSREIVGMIPAVSRDSSLERAALNQTIRSFVAPASIPVDITPGQLPPDTGDQTIGNKTITISKSQAVPFRWAGEEQKGMDTGPGYQNIRRDQMAQAFRGLCNAIELGLTGFYNQASRAVVPAGTHLFDAANYKDIANVRQILVENGAPLNDLSVVLNPAAGALFRGNAQNNAYINVGTANFLEQGNLINLHGMNLRESQQIYSSVASGTASGATTDNAGYAVGTTTLNLASAGSGTILAGDTIKITGDASGAHYVVVTGNAAVGSGGTIVIAAPGLKGALSAATHAITVDSASDKNMAFSRNALHLVTRVPARPYEGDRAEDVMVMQDPRSGLGFEVALYKEYRRVHYEVSCAWGYAMIKPEHCALLLGQ